MCVVIIEVRISAGSPGQDTSLCPVVPGSIDRRVRKLPLSESRIAVECLQARIFGELLGKIGHFVPCCCSAENIKARGSFSIAAHSPFKTRFARVPVGRSFTVRAFRHTRDNRRRVVHRNSDETGFRSTYVTIAQCALGHSRKSSARSSPTEEQSWAN